MYSLVLKMQIKNMITAVLNVPGNLTRSSVNAAKVIQMKGKNAATEKNVPMEIAIVLDMTLPEEQLVENVKMLAECIKGHSELFRNTRVNMIYWYGQNIEGGISSLPQLLLGKVLAENSKETVFCDASKDITILLEKLRKFYARTKVVFLITDGQYEVADKVYASRLLQPFLGKKMLQLKVGKEEVLCERFCL